MNDGSQGESKYVVFRLGEQRYGLPIGRVERIVPAAPVTGLPGDTGNFLGVVDLRGETVRVLDTERRFGTLPSAVGHPQFVVVRSSDGPCAVTVDSVEAIAALQSSDIEPSPSFNAADGGGFIAAIGRTNDRLLLLLDADALVHAA